jgi:hypothetical protein
VVSGDAIHVDRLLGDAPKEVSSADDDSNLAAESMDIGNLFSDLVDKDGVDSESGAGSERFAGELEENSFVHVSI